MPAFFKVKHVFAYPGYGWQETYYISGGAGNTTAAAQAGATLALARMPLMSQNCVLQEIQASQEPDPTWTMNTPNYNPLQYRGDSIVLNAPARPDPCIAYGTAPAGDADPWQSYQFMVTGTIDGTLTPPFYRRSNHLRGLSENMIGVTIGGQFTVPPACQTVLLNYFRALWQGQWCIRAVDKGNPFQAITGLVAGTATNTLQVQTAVPLNVVAGQSITISGWPRGVPGYNGGHRVIGLVGTNPLIYSSLGVVPVPKNAKAALRVLRYFPITLPLAPGVLAPSATAALQLPPVRFRKRDTGRDLFVSRAQKRRRPSLTP